MSHFLFQLSQLIVNAGGVAAVVDYVGESKGNVRLPGIMMLGYVAAHSENLAMAVIVSKVCVLFFSTIINCRTKNGKVSKICSSLNFYAFCAQAIAQVQISKTI